jgi:hypothetical protein
MEPREPIQPVTITATVLFGYLLGDISYCWSCNGFADLATLTGLSVAFAGLFAPAPTGRRAWPEKVSSLALIAYVGFLILAELKTGRSPLDSRSGDHVLLSVGFLSPCLIGCIMAPHRPYERARWPWWLLTFAATVIVTYNAVNTRSRVALLYVAYE